MGCCSCVENNQSIKIRTCTSRVIEHGPGVKCYIPCADIQVIEKINLTAEQYLKVTYLTPREHGDLIEHVPGPCIFHQDDAYAVVEGPLKKIELNGSEYVICSDPKTGQRHVVEGPIMYMPKLPILEKFESNLVLKHSLLELLIKMILFNPSSS